MKRAISFFLAVMMVFTLVPFVSAASPSFVDVPRNHWAYKAITDMAERGIIVGYDDKRFRPNNLVTRAEFAKIMIAAADVDIDRRNVSQTFQDVPKSHWAFYYVESAKPYLTGYKSGSKYTYKPNEAAVREDIAVAMVRLLGYDKSVKADLNVLKRFRDDDRISPNLRSYVAIAIQKDLMQGSDNRFRPLDAITRAEAASLLHRALIERKNNDESKVVFPNPTPTPEKPELPATVTDNFSNTELKNWKTDSATGTWGVINKQVTAIELDEDIEHYFLPLNWKESTEPEKYELIVDVIPSGTNGYGGVFFNGVKDKTNVVYVQKDRVILGKVTDVEDDDVDVIASGNYKLKATNRLKVVVNGTTVSIYMNDQFLFSQKQVKQEGTKLGLYLKAEATKDAPRKMTYLDNFTFKAFE
ncbi:S-layer homology domain-containing protein [Brevibacillus panacihumi]|uniref:S-layer homology domain-containing protein n=1 Tax=Brevibacillus panacihumi TaxID=497735 RepID=UPI003CFDA417